MSKQKAVKLAGRPKGKPRTDAEIAADAKRTGRPTMTEGESANVVVTVRLTPTEHKQLTKDAKRAKMNLAAYLRHCWYGAKDS